MMQRLLIAVIVVAIFLVGYWTRELQVVYREKRELKKKDAKLSRAVKRK